VTEKGDTTYRLVRSSSFNGRVEPIWMHFRKTQDRRSMIGSFLEKRRVKTLVSQIKEALQGQGAPQVAWDREEGECVASLKVARMGLFFELRQLATRKIPASRHERIPHFLRVRESNAYSIPVDFAEPFEVGGPESRDRVPIVSSVRLQKELDWLGDTLQIGRKMKVDKMVAFMRVEEPDVAKADSKHDPTFWSSFGFTCLKKLADLSVEHTLPIVFA
jgi:hypothetical protein